MMFQSHKAFAKSQVRHATEIGARNDHGGGTWVSDTAKQSESMGFPRITAGVPISRERTHSGRLLRLVVGVYLYY